MIIPCFNRLTMHHLTSSQLRQAADLKEKIAALEAELADLLGGTTLVLAAATIEEVQAPEPAELTRPGKRTMSPAHKAAIRAAQALRWAKYNAAKGKPAKTEGKKRKMSAAGRAAIIAGVKARWAKVKAGEK